MKNQKLQQAEEYLKSGREIIKIVLDPATRLTVRERALKRCIISFADFALPHSGEQPEGIKKMIENQQDMPSEFADIVNENFHELLSKEEQPMTKEQPEREEALEKEMHYAFMAHGDGWEMDPQLNDIYDHAIKAAKNYAKSQKQAWLKERRELVEAAEQLVHLHMCEMEGMQSGQPAKKDWLNAVYNLSEILNSINTK